jgi:hypothetical protein
MKRYEWSSDYPGNLEEADNGPYVFYSEYKALQHRAERAEAALSSQEARIKELLTAVRSAAQNCRECEDGKIKRYFSNAGSYNMVDCACCGPARQALAPERERK